MTSNWSGTSFWARARALRAASVAPPTNELASSDSVEIGLPQEGQGDGSAAQYGSTLSDDDDGEVEFLAMSDNEPGDGREVAVGAASQHSGSPSLSISRNSGVLSSPAGTGTDRVSSPDSEDEVVLVLANDDEAADSYPVDAGAASGAPAHVC